MKKRELLYEGKAKRIYAAQEEDRVVIEFKDDATAFNGKKKGQIRNKGILNTEISSIFFRYLEKKGIPTHLIKEISTNEIVARKLKIIPIEVVVRNIAAGSLARRLGLEEGEALKMPVLEFYYKDDELGDPLINKDHIYALELAGKEELQQMHELALKINELLISYLKDRGIILVDFKLEFGNSQDGQIYLADEISPDTCRFWDNISREILDKDRFRQELDNVEGAYQEILKRLKN